MPELALDALQGRMLLIAAFIGNGSLSEGAALARRNVVRLVDKAVYEYACARATLIAQIDEALRPPEEVAKGRYIYLLGFTNHMENCINAVRRVLALLEFLRSDPTASFQDRLSRRQITANFELLKDMRDTIEHFDRDDYETGQPVMLALSDDGLGIHIGSHALSFATLCSVIAALHSEAVRLLEVPHQKRGDSPTANLPP